VYTEKILTQQVYLHTASEVTGGAIALFGAGAHHSRGCLTVIDGFIELDASPEVCEAFASTQQRLDRLLTAKLENPGLDVSAASIPLLQATMALARCM
jgi:hypothetical protein